MNDHHIDREYVEREIRRLAPWYYFFDLASVTTDITEPFDHWGHRRVEAPLPRPGFWTGKAVLDLGCNEGGYSFSALSSGALSAHGVDCRDINVEKARFVAEVLGHSQATFEVGEVDGWLADNRGSSFDIVLACGLLYHLPDPRETLRGACAVASGGIVLTSVLAGGPDGGYTSFEEAESIGASADPSEFSKMPNTALTIVSELETNGFHPIFISETRNDGEGEVWGGCLVIAERPQAFLVREISREDRDDAHLAVFVAPRARDGEGGGLDLEVLLYDLSGRQREIELQVQLAHGSSAATDAPHAESRALSLAARPLNQDASGTAGTSTTATMPFELGSDSSAEIRLLAFEAGAEQPSLDRRIEIGRQ